MVERDRDEGGLRISMIAGTTNVSWLGKYVLAGISLITVVTLSFSCNILGPRNSSGPDTTSSAFSWTVDTIGGPSSTLFDCSVINDTLAYAVGSIKLQSGFYNVARWNGTTWSFITLKGFPPGSGGDSAYGAGSAVFANSARDVWVVAGFVFHFDGNTWTVFYNTGAEDANKIWSSGANDLWYVGNNGMIVHYSNGYWQRVQSGTTLPFQDIWGDGGQVLAIASDKFGVGGKYLVQLKGNTAVHLSDTIPSAVSLSGVWFKANQKYLLVGDGVLTKESLSSQSWQYDFNRTASSYYSLAVRGTGVDNVVIAGDHGDMSFYNGVRWTKYGELYNPIDQLRSVSIKGNVIIAAGIRTYSGIQYYGVIYTGRR